MGKGGYGLTYQEVYEMENLTIEAKAIYGMLCSYAGSKATVADYIELVRSSKNEAVKEQMNAIMNTGLLIVDDIGATKEDKDWISDAIYRLVNRRYENMLPTIYTSNVMIDNLKCDDRISSRIMETSTVLAMPEFSVRKKKADERNEAFLRGILEE